MAASKNLFVVHVQLAPRRVDRCRTPVIIIYSCASCTPFISVMSTFRVPTPILMEEALRQFSESESISSNEDGEYYAHSVASRVKTTDVVTQLLLSPSLSDWKANRLIFLFLLGRLFTSFKIIM